MAKATFFQNRFTSGVLSRKLWGQFTLRKYAMGLSVCKNMLPLLQGPVVKRPGVRQIDVRDIIIDHQDTYGKTSSDDIRIINMIEFQYSTTDVRIVVFTRVGIFVLDPNDGDDRLTLPTASEENEDEGTEEGESNEEQVTSTQFILHEFGEDAKDLYFAQSNDVLYLLHSNYPPTQLIRGAYWSISPVLFTPSPLKLLLEEDVGKENSGDMKIVYSGGAKKWTLRYKASKYKRRYKHPNTANVIRNRIIYRDAHGSPTNFYDYAHRVGDRYIPEDRVRNYSTLVQRRSRDDRFNAVKRDPVSRKNEAEGGVAAELTLDNLYAMQRAAYKDYHGYIIRDTRNQTRTTGKQYINGNVADFNDRHVRITIGSGDNVRFLDFIIDDLARIETEGTNITPDNLYSDSDYFEVELKPLSDEEINQTRDVTYNVNPGESWMGYFYSGGTRSTCNYPTSCTFHRGRFIVGGTRVPTQTFYASKSNDYHNFEVLDAKLETSDQAGIIATIDSNYATTIQWMNSGRYLEIGTDSGIYIVRGSQLEEVITNSNVGATLVSEDRSKNVRPYDIEGSTFFIDADGLKLNELIRSQASIDKEYSVRNLNLLSDEIGKKGIIDMAYCKSPNSTIWVVFKDGSVGSILYSQAERIIGWAMHSFRGWKVNSVVSVPAFNVRNNDGTLPKDYINPYDRVYFSATYTNEEGIERGAILYLPDFFDTSVGYKPGDISFIDTNSFLDEDNKNNSDYKRDPVRGEIVTLPLVARLQNGTSQNRITNIHSVHVNVYDSGSIWVHKAGGKESDRVLSKEDELLNDKQSLQTPGGADINIRFVIYNDEDKPFNIRHIELEGEIAEAVSSSSGGGA